MDANDCPNCGRSLLVLHLASDSYTEWCETCDGQVPATAMVMDLDEECNCPMCRAMHDDSDDGYREPLSVLAPAPKSEFKRMEPRGRKKYLDSMRRNARRTKRQQFE